MDHLTGYIRGCIGTEPADSFSHVFRLTRPAHRNELEERLLHLTLKELPSFQCE
jgi:hypothetical protein